MYNRMLVTVCIHVTVYMYVLCHTLFLEPTEHMGKASNIERRDNLPNMPEHGSTDSETDTIFILSFHSYELHFGTFIEHDGKSFYRH